jgi:hypothetical protein
VLEFLIRAQEAYDLNLLSDVEFLAILEGSTSSRVTQIVGHLDGVPFVLISPLLSFLNAFRKTFCLDTCCGASNRLFNS